MEIKLKDAELVRRIAEGYDREAEGVRTPARQSKFSGYR